MVGIVAFPTLVALVVVVADRGGSPRGQRVTKLCDEQVQILLTTTDLVDFERASGGNLTLAKWLGVRKTKCKRTHRSLPAADLRLPGFQPQCPDNGIYIIVRANTVVLHPGQERPMVIR